MRRVSPFLFALLLSACTSAPRLQEGHWDSFNRERLDALIESCGRESASYDAAHPPYAVFDWDNTTIFLDIEEAVLAYQLENLAFRMTPGEMDAAIRTGVPEGDFVKSCNNAAGEPVSIGKVAPDIVESWAWLQAHGGREKLAELRGTPQFEAFRAKMRYLYEAIGETFDHSVSYPWVTYLFAGMKEGEVRELTAATVEWQKAQAVGEVEWKSPEAIPGKAGVVSVKWKNGLRVVPEMQDLYRTLRDAGFDVWVCSASFVDAVKEISSNPSIGYANPADRVLAMELERTADGVIRAEFRKGYDQTQGPGKTATIRRFLVTRYGCGPAFVAGDSEGDQDMMKDFPDTKLVLIVNRLRKPGTEIGRLSKVAAESRGRAEAKYLLQGRDDNTGSFRPAPESVKLGAKDPALLAK